MNSYCHELLAKIQNAQRMAVRFFDSLKTTAGYKYTTTHDVQQYPAATLYGTWAVVLGLNLLGELDKWSDDQKTWAVTCLLEHRRQDGTFLGKGLQNHRNTKSLEYLILHCTNYAHGAMLVLDPEYDFQTPYLHRFLDGDALAKWLDGRSLLRPWEEGNNIVNVASYLALCLEHGDPSAGDRLYQMLEWHRKNQNPITSGFDAFTSASSRNVEQALAGAVHNFHIHLFLNESLGYERLIADRVANFLLDGPLTACLSIDFVELAVRTIEHASEPQHLVWALLSHADALLDYQRSDGGWLENATSIPTKAAGFSDTLTSSCSYATWFRLASLGMIAIVLCGDSPDHWRFRKTLGMGYAPGQWPSVPAGVLIQTMPVRLRMAKLVSGVPDRLKKQAVKLGSRLL